MSGIVPAFFGSDVSTKNRDCALLREGKGRSKVVANTLLA